MFSSNLEVFISSNGLKCRTLQEICFHGIDKDPDFKILTSEGFKKLKITPKDSKSWKGSPIEAYLDYDSIVLDSSSGIKTRKQSLKVSDLLPNDLLNINHTPVKVNSEYRNSFYNRIKPFLMYCFSTLIPSDNKIKVCTDISNTSKNRLTDAIKAFYDFSGVDRIDYVSFEENSEFVVEITNQVVLQNIYDFILDGTPILDYTLTERLDLLTEIIKSNNNGNPSGRILICMDFALDLFKRLVTSVGWNYEIVSVNKFALDDGYEGYAYTVHIIDNIVATQNVGKVKKIEKCSEETLKTLYPVDIEGLTSEGLVLTNGIVI